MHMNTVKVNTIASRQYVAMMMKAENIGFVVSSYSGLCSITLYNSSSVCKYPVDGFWIGGFFGSTHRYYEYEISPKQRFIKTTIFFSMNENSPTSQNRPTVHTYICDSGSRITKKDAVDSYNANKSTELFVEIPVFVLPYSFFFSLECRFYFQSKNRHLMPILTTYVILMFPFNMVHSSYQHSNNKKKRQIYKWHG